jgi:acyl carrier protein
MIEEQVRTFILKDLGAHRFGVDLTDDYPFLQDGLIDSFGVAELVEFIENEYGVPLKLDELALENFGTVGTIAAMIRSKVSEGGPAPIA